MVPNEAIMITAVPLDYSPLPKAGVARDQPPMRDEMVFKSATKIRRVTSVPVVPHRLVQKP